MTGKILLINAGERAEYPMPPIGLMAVASAVTQEGHQVKILDLPVLDITYNDVQRIASECNIIGLTAMTTNIRDAIAVANLVKKNTPTPPVILGGPFGTLLPEVTLEIGKSIDILVRGEGENTIIELMAALSNGGSLQDIRGISYRDNGAIVHNPDRIQGQGDYYDLDKQLISPYKFLPTIWKYRPHPPRGRYSPFFMLVTSRGCPYFCRFCAKPVFGSVYRSQSPQHIAAEIEYLKQKHGAREICFFDDIFVMNRSNVLELCELIKGMNIAWTCEARVDRVDRQMLKAMKNAGCYAIAYGIESSSQAVLDILGKRITPEQSEEAIAITREAGIETLGYMMIGSPGEDEQGIRNTIEFTKKLRLDFVQFAITTAYPGTDIHKDYQRMFPGDKPDWDKFLYENKPVAPVFTKDGLDRAKLTELAAKANREFYFRPAYIWQRLKRIRRWRDIKVYLDGAWMLVKNLILRKPIDKFKEAK